MPRITYNGFRNQAQRKELREGVNRYLRKHLPGWCQSVSVECHDTDSETILAVKCDPAGRALVLNVYPEYFTEPEKEQARTFAHELAHILHAPVYIWVYERLIGCLVDDSMREFANQEFEERIESHAEDMATLFIDHLKLGKAVE